MGFSSFKLSSVAAQCGCCTSDCTWELSVTVRSCTGMGGTYPLRGCDVRFQGPDGTDTTVHCSTTQNVATIASAAPGDWTITVSHDSYTSEVRTCTVVQCQSIALDVMLYLAFTTFHYSDDHGSCDIDITRKCLGMCGYEYTSDNVVMPVDCGYGNIQCLTGQTGSIDPNVGIAFRPSDDGTGITFGILARNVYVASFAQSGCNGTYTTGCASSLGDCSGARYGAGVDNLTVPLSAPTWTGAIGPCCDGTVTATISFS